MITQTTSNIRYGWMKEDPINLRKIWERRMSIISWVYLAIGFVGLVYLECRLNGG